MSAPSTLSRGRLRLGLLVAAVLVVLVVVLTLVVAMSGESPPATGAASLVPDDALAYIHASTSPDRAAVTQALHVAARLPDYPLFAALITRRLGALAGRGGVDFRRDIRPWLGDEAALALLNTRTSTIGSIVILDVRSRAKATAFITAAGAATAGAYRGTGLYRSSSGAELAFVRHYLVVGQPAGVRSAIDAASGRRPALSASGAYRRAAAGEPADRVLDAYASPIGVRRLLVPQGGVIAAVGALVDQPALTGVTVSLSATTAGAMVRVHSALDPNLQRVGATAAGFTPTLDSVIPAGSMLLLDVNGLNRAAPHLLGAIAAGGVLRGLGPLLSRLGSALAAEGVDVNSIESLFGGETVVAIGPATSSSRKGQAISPSLIIVTRTSKESATTAKLANLEPALAQLFPAPSSGSGQVPEFADRPINGVTAHELSLAPGLQLDYSVFRGLVVISTGLNGIGAVAARGRALVDQGSYSVTLTDHPQRVSSLLFLDFNQLLKLAEQTGLFRGSRYRQLRPDLQKVRAVGLTSTRGEADSTAELTLQIP